MSQTVVLDEALIAQARSLTGLQSDSEVVELALQELINRSRQRSLLDLAGRIDFTEHFDHKPFRALRDGAD